VVIHGIAIVQLLQCGQHPNYFYHCGNVVAIAEFDEEMKLILKTFEATPNIFVS